VALATGAAGDVSTRHTRRAQDFQEVDRFGRALAEHAQQALREATPIQLCAPLVAEEPISLPCRSPNADEHEAAAREQLRHERDALLHAGRLAEARTVKTSLQALAFGPRDWPAAIHTHVGVARLGDAMLVGVPGELYNQLGAAIRQASQHVLLLGYANGYIGYIPTRGAYTHGLDYEVSASRLAPGAGEQLVEAVTGLMNSRLSACHPERSEGSASPTFRVAWVTDPSLRSG
jgi:hypothetical protein